ncbi:MAG: hypothetical protein H6810_04485 [Phycisphaeraceae bacterium]|nr:MAG: hypothetical protein H6810_04485 [Phycisphaeraceae bacterium]
MIDAPVTLGLSAPAEITLPPEGRSAPVQLSLVLSNAGGTPVEVDLADTITLERRLADGSWVRWSRGQNGVRPGPHRVAIDPGGSVRVDLAARCRNESGGFSLQGEDPTGAQWWFGPVDAGESLLVLRAIIRSGGLNLVSDAIEICIRP